MCGADQAAQPVKKINPESVTLRMQDHLEEVKVIFFTREREKVDVKKFFIARLTRGRGER